MASPNTNLHRIWSEALERYQYVSGISLKASDITRFNSIESFRQGIENQQSKFEEYRNVRGSLWRSLSAVLAPVEILGGVVAEGASAVFPATPVIMGAVSFLIQGARGVSQSYDYLQELFDDMKAILARLQVHTKKEYISNELSTIFAEILSCILEIFGLSTKFISDGRAKRFFKTTFRPDEDRASDLKAKLQKLVDQESAMVGALNLDTTTDVLAQTTLVGGIVRGVDSKMDGLAESIEELSRKLQASRSPGDDIAKDLVSIKNTLQPHSGVEDDLALLRCMKGTGEWILAEPLLQKWLRGEIPIVRLSGGAGTGKSHLSSFIINHLQQTKLLDSLKQPSGIAPRVGYFFFKEGDPGRINFNDALRTMAYQVAQNSSAYMNFIKKVPGGSDGLSSLPGTWKKLFHVFLSQKFSDRVCLIFDGIDEAKRDDLVKFLDLLLDIQEQQQSANISVLLVGRPEMEWYLEEVFYENPVPCLDITARKNKQAIEIYITQMLEKYRSLRKLSKSLRNEIIAALSAAADSMFLWADLMLKDISTKNREAAIRSCLKQLPKDLPSTYRRMFQNIADRLVDEPDQAQDLKEILTWVGFATRPLSILELESLLSLRSDDGTCDILDLEGELGKKYASLFTIVRKSHQHFWSFSESSDSQTISSSKIVEEDFDEDRKPDEEPDQESDEEDDDPMTIYQKMDLLVRLRHASLGDFLKTEISTITLGEALQDVNLHLLKTCFKTMLNPSYMPTSEIQYQLTKDVLAKSPHLAFASYALSNWYNHLQMVPKTIAIEDKAYILTALHEILTNADIIGAQLRNPHENIGFNVTDALKDGSWIETIILWLKEEDGLSLCDPEVQDWASSIIQNRSEIIRPVVLALYEIVLGGRVDPLKSTKDGRWNDKWGQYLLAHAGAFLKYIGSPPLEMESGWDSPTTVGGVDSAAKNILRKRDDLTILEWGSLDRRPIWYASAASIMGGITGSYRLSVEYYLRALDMEFENCDVKILLRGRLASVYRRLKEYDKAISTWEKALEMVQESGNKLEDLEYVGARPWSFGRREAGGYLMELGTCLRHALPDHQGYIKGLDKYLEPAVRIDPHRDGLINDFLLLSNSRQLWDKAEKDRPEVFVNLIRKMSQIRSLKTNRYSRLTEYLLKRLRNDLLEKLHKNLKDTNEDTEFIFKILFDAFEAAEKYADSAAVASVESCIAFAYDQFKKDTKMAILYRERFVDKCVFQSQTGVLTANKGIERYYLDEIADPLFKNYRRCILGLVTTDTFAQKALHKIEKLDQLDMLRQDARNVSIAAFLGAYNRHHGRKDAAKAYFKRCVETCVRILEASLENDNYQDKRSREPAWEMLAQTACANADEVNFKWAFWARYAYKGSYEMDEYSYTNMHGRRMADEFSVYNYQSCAFCEKGIKMTDEDPLVCCQFTFDKYCNNCLDLLKKGKSGITECHPSHSWLKFSATYFPEPKEDENMTDEEEINLVIQRFKSAYL